VGNHLFEIASPKARRKLRLALVFVLAAYGTLSSSAYARARLELGNPPSFHFGDWLQLRPRAKVQLDVRDFRPQLDEEGIFVGRRLRFGLDGTLFSQVDFTARLETRKSPEFRDLFVKYRRFGTFQAQAGRFKIPFGLNQLTDSGELDFVYRSRIGSIVAPGRDTGAMILGEIAEDALQYSAGMFLHDGRNSEIEDFASSGDTLPGGNRTVAARVVLKPARLVRVPVLIQSLTIGGAFTRSDVDPGLSSLPGLTVSNQVFFPRMYVSGTRTRRGAELSGKVRYLTIKAEFSDTIEQRLGQGLRGEDLPSLHTQGWYVSAVHPVIGHLDQSEEAGFLHSLLPGRNLGLIEVAARYEVIRFGSVANGNTSPSRSPRAANVLGNEDQVWSVGLNWKATRYVKLQLNGVHETLRDPVRNPIAGQSNYWTLATRLQLYF
jgi:phosphate-selective porin